MNKLLYPVTLLLSVVCLLPFFGFSTIEKGIPTWIIGDIPTMHDVFSIEEATFSQLFAVKTQEKNLLLEVYTTSGQKIPGNIYRYHKNGEITYEIGRGLTAGLYIVKMSLNETDQYVKLIRFGY